MLRPQKALGRVGCLLTLASNTVSLLHFRFEGEQVEREKFLDRGAVLMLPSCCDLFLMKEAPGAGMAGRLQEQRADSKPGESISWRADTAAALGPASTGARASRSAAAAVAHAPSAEQPEGNSTGCLSGRREMIVCIIWVGAKPRSLNICPQLGDAGAEALCRAAFPCIAWRCSRW